MFEKLFGRFKANLPKANARVQTWRQGDVFIIATASLPAGLKPRPPVLAEGEVTGHAHRLQTGSSAQVLGDGVRGLFLAVEGTEATVVHEEHGPVTVPRGNYIVRIQREYHPQEIRRVVD